MTAAVLSLPRGGAGARAPLVPPGVDLLEDEIFLRLPAWIFDSEWAIECTRDERLAGITLRTRALKQVGNAGSLPASDRLLARLADYGDDVAGWDAVKTKALEGWIPCSDGRWHHPEIARNVLHIWIGRLESRRVSAWGNKGRTKKGNGRSLNSIMDDIDAALDALAAIDPQDAVLGRSTDQQIKWRDRIVEAANLATGETVRSIETSYEGPNRPPIRTPLEGDPKVRQAKRSQSNSSSLLCNDDSSDPENPGLEFEQDKGSAKRTHRTENMDRPQPEPWPTKSFERFQERYPKREAWGRAEKVWERLRKAGKVPFEEIMAGVERLVARIERGELEARFACQPAKWLDGRGWEDDPDPPNPGAAEPGKRPVRGRPSALHGLRRRFETRPQPGDGP